jgi:hypothetical protein
MGYNDTNRLPKVDEPAYVLESRKQGAPWLKGKIVGINHDDQKVLVEVQPESNPGEIKVKLYQASTTDIMFGETPNREPEARVD